MISPNQPGLNLKNQFDFGRSLGTAALLVLYISLFSCIGQKEIKDFSRINEVDVFWGIEKTKKREGHAVSLQLPRIDTSWYDVREIFGGTHPGASLPFSLVSTNVQGIKKYKTGYPTGYFKDQFYGISHFHASGTGTIRWYGNYFLMTPSEGELLFDQQSRSIVKEWARPGQYNCLLNDGISISSTVSGRSSHQKIIFTKAEQNHLVINLASYLQARDSIRVPPNMFPASININELTSNTSAGYITMGGVSIYFHIFCDQVADQFGIFSGDSVVLGTSIQMEHTEQAGLFFSYNSLLNNTLEVSLQFSMINEEDARQKVGGNYDTNRFQEHSDEAGQIWDQYLTKFQILEGDSVKSKIFYNALYRSLIKPTVFPGKTTKGDKKLVTDLATAWDVYVCQLPFIFTFYPDIGREIVDFYISAFNEYDVFPPASLLKEGLPWVFSKQASALGVSILTDAYFRQIDGQDWETVLLTFQKSLNSERALQFAQGNVLAPSPTHNVDYAYAAFCAATLAHEFERDSLSADFYALANLWRAVYDSIGLLIQTEEMYETALYPRQHFKFYEGNRWNHSLKIWHDMAALIDLQGGKKQFIKNLDCYFNITRNQTEFQFQGLNNEVDYTTPYAYLYANRPDRTQQILRIAMEYRFNLGRGGLPGNDDSGAMSSWFVWNALGIFPVVGQDLFLVGSPIFQEVEINIRGKKLLIKADNNSAKHIYVAGLRLNGTPIQRPFLHTEEILNGGILEFDMSDQPSNWGTAHVPPSQMN